MNILSLNCLSRNKPDQAVHNTDSVVADARVEVRGPKLNSLLVGERVDIAGLQELTRPWRNWLYEHLDGAYRTVGTYTRDTGEGGLIVYRDDLFSVVENGAFWLAPGAPLKPERGWDARFDRLCAWAVFRVRKTGKYFVFLTAHLDHEGIFARPEQAKLIVANIKPLREKVAREYGCHDCPLFLTGDMNSMPDSETYRIFCSALLDSRKICRGETVDEALSTSPGFQWVSSAADEDRHGHVIDYIFLTGDVMVDHFRMISTTTNLCQYGEFISDHNAILVSVFF